MWKYKEAAQILGMFTQKSNEFKDAYSQQSKGV